MNFRRILLYNLLGVALVTTCWLPRFLVWSSVDDAIFWFFSQFITVDYPTWTGILAALNTRAFDRTMFVLLVVMPYIAMKRDPQSGWLKRSAIGLVMLVCATSIMVGAHWVSDVSVGALSIALIALPWVLVFQTGLPFVRAAFIGRLAAIEPWF